MDNGLPTRKGANGLSEQAMLEKSPGRTRHLSRKARLLPLVALASAVAAALFLGAGLPAVMETLASLAAVLVSALIATSQYRQTGHQRLFLFPAGLLSLSLASTVSYLVTPGGVIWWLGQALRLVVYLAALGYALKEYTTMSHHLAAESRKRQEVERAQHQAEADWHNTFDSLEEVVLIIDTDYRIEKINSRGLALFGRSQEEVIGRKCYEVVDSSNQPSEYCPLRQALRSQKAVSVECYHQLTGRHFSLRSVPIIDEHGQIAKFVYLMKDITKEVKAKERERELVQELNLTSRLASIGEAAAGIAHEINNPLTGVIGFAQMLSQMDIPEDIREAVEVIEDGARRTAGIVEKLLTFARRNRPEKEYADINYIVKSALDIRSYELRTNNIEVITQLAPDLPRTMANVGQLQQVFLNIIVNAEQAMARANGRGRLLVKTEKVNGYIRVSIADNGPGISKDNLGKIFDPFFTTKGEDGGTGLGLSISYGIIKEHRGKIRARSTLGKGTTFIIELPILKEAKPEEDAEPAEEEPQRVSGARILVVDDEPNICRVLERLLSREGHSVDTMPDAQRALDSLRDTKYDLILLDLKMPGMSGIEFFNQMKEIDPSLEGKVVCITGDVISPRNKAFLDSTRIPCIVKPFTAEQLMRQVKLGLGGNGGHAQTTYSYR